MNDVIKLEELEFVKLIEAREIHSRIAVLASQMETYLADKDPLFIVVLNGAFIFGADLLRHFNFECDVEFVSAKSYEGLESTQLLKLDETYLPNVKDRYVVIIEDIVDSGFTIKNVKELCIQNGASYVEVAAFLSKPSEWTHDIDIKYVGFEIGPLFVIGYGLDYNGKGRNLKDIYQLRPFVK